MLNLLVVGIDVLTHGLRLAEVERCSLHEADFAGGNRCVVDGEIEIGVDLTDLVVDGGSGIGDALQREESVAGEVQNGLLVGLCHILDDEFVFIGESIYNRYFHLTGITLFTIRTYVLQYKCFIIHLKGFPNLGIPAFQTTMQGVGTIVDGELILLAVQLELAAADAVAIATDERREIRLGAVDDSFDGVVSLDDVGIVAVAVGNHNGYEGASVIGDGNFIAQTVFQNVKIGLFAVDSGLEVFALQTTEIRCFHCVHDCYSF